MVTTGRRRSRRTPDPVVMDGVGRDVLDERIRLLEAGVKRLPGMTEARLAQQRPGGEHNRDPSAMGALAYLCWLHGQYAGGPAAPKTTVARWSQQAVDDLRAAFAAEPVHVTLESGRQVAVHPKGSLAAMRIVRNQLVTEWVQATRYTLLDQKPVTTDLIALIDLATRAEARLRAEWLWIVTHPGPRLPWAITGPDAVTTFDPEPPAEYHDALTIGDEVLLQRAFLETNYLRVATLSERARQQMGSKEGESAPLAHFLGVIAAEHGVQPEVMARDWSVGAAFASALSRAESTDKAMKRADAARASTSASR